MLMKIHNKGQVVIPTRIRHLLNLEVGDFLDVKFTMGRRHVRMSKPRRAKPSSLAGAFARYGRARSTFPSRREMHRALADGLARDP